MKIFALLLSLVLMSPAAYAHYNYHGYKYSKKSYHKHSKSYYGGYKHNHSKKHGYKQKGQYCGKNKAPKYPVVADFDAEFYYIDNSQKMIYKGMLSGTDVVLKKLQSSPYSSAYLSQLDHKTLTVVESSGSKRITAIDLETQRMEVIGNFPFSGTITQSFSSIDYVLVNQEGTSNIQYKNLDEEDGSTGVLGRVKLNGKDMKISGGDLYVSVAGVLYMVTNGTLYSLENDPEDETILNATVIVSGLGSVTGLVEIDNGTMLVSTMNSSTMKLVKAFSGTVETLTLKGDLKKTGTRGGDLAGFNTL